MERSGNLVVEVGRQELATKTGTFAARQKYTHVMRKTADGWRFAVLMSNNSE
jgi:FMN-dependent NADH-azoreductase